MDDAAKAAKRAEIAAKVAAMQAEQKRQEEQRATHFGEHQGITCDGCGATPLIGYRYRCRKCSNHDICENCYERFDGGKGTVANGLAKQAISLNPADHEFYVHKERGFKPLVKQQGPTAKSEKKAKPNDPCPGGCGQKVKKCKCSAK